MIIRRFYFNRLSFFNSEQRSTFISTIHLRHVEMVWFYKVHKMVQPTKRVFLKAEFVKYISTVCC